MQGSGETDQTMAKELDLNASRTHETTEETAVSRQRW